MTTTTAPPIVGDAMHPVAHAKTDKPQARRPFVHQEFSRAITGAMLRQDDRDLELRRRIMRRPATLRSIRIGKRGFQSLPEAPESLHARRGFQLIDDIA